MTCVHQKRDHPATADLTTDALSRAGGLPEGRATEVREGVWRKPPLQATDGEGPGGAESTGTQTPALGLRGTEDSQQLVNLKEDPGLQKGRRSPTDTLISAL